MMKHDSRGPFLAFEGEPSYFFAVLLMVDSHVHIIVEGLVQGVGFRWYVSRIADSLQLSGYVTNRPEGTVEIVARGDRSLLQDFIQQVRVGPRSSRVANVRLRWNRPEDRPPADERSNFEIR